MEKLLKTRSSYYGQLTRFANILQAVTGDNFDLVTLQARHDGFILLRDKFNNLQDEIELELDPKKLAEENDRERFEDEYYRIEVMYRKILKKFTSEMNDSNASQISDENKIVKLPAINLSKFDGDVKNYISFKNIFNSLIHENRELSNTQKFIYLRSSLVGSALEIVSSLTVCGENYEIALRMLDDRYRNTRNITQAHLRALFELNLVKSGNVSTLRDLIDQVNKSISALRSLKEPVEHWDSLIVYLILTKLDPETREFFEIGFKEDRMPQLRELIDCLSKRCTSFECLSNENTEKTKGKSYRSFNAVVAKDFDSNDKCPNCSLKHKIYNCPNFISFSPQARFDFIKDKKLCLKCLGFNHKFKNCRYKVCYKCGKDHNYLLHFEEKPINSGPAVSSDSTVRENSTSLHSVNHSSKVLLYTAVIRIRDGNGRFVSVRGVIDPGSQVNVISERITKLLRLKTRPIYANINGFGKVSKSIDKYIDVIAYANNSNYSFTFEAFVHPSITDDLPNSEFNAFTEFSNLNLADSNYNKPGKIDFLLSNGVYTKILKSGIVEYEEGRLKGINTDLGYIIGGLNSENAGFVRNVILAVTHELPSIEEKIEKFWTIEEIPKEILSTESELCDKHFETTVRRLPTGRFSVQLPFSRNDFDFSFSKGFALKRFFSLEKRFRTQPVFKQEYIKFMQEFKELGHMRAVCFNDRNSIGYYLPHHGVINTNSATTKLRVVFDGSSSPCSTTSLNSVLYTGAKLQNDIVAILMRFRFYRYCFLADIKKMYRMIEVQPEHRCYQRVLWREDESKLVEEFELTTVTYGLKPSPYLAIKCLHRLADENKEKFPDASKIIKNDMFVDDVVSGFNSINQGIVILRQIVDILESAKFSLHKWKSNVIDLIRPFQELKSQNEVYTIAGDLDRILGIGWQPEVDKLTFSFSDFSVQTVTKRIVLSKLAGIFDPLGYLSPFVVRGKLFMQKLWSTKIDWDDILPSDLQIGWNEFSNDFRNHKLISFDRFVDVTFEECFELLGFCDASLCAYGACIYVKSKEKSNLLVAKSKVAPLKIKDNCNEELSIARLELLAAVLLCRLMKFIVESLPVSPSSISFFCDSQVVLAWLRKPASHWKIFVSNRVAEIQKAFDTKLWSYIPSQGNPADLISRGCCLLKLSKSDLWWHGPTLKNVADESFETTLEYRKEPKIALFVSVKYLNKFSSYRTSVRVMAYILRFVENCKVPNIKRRKNEIEPVEMQLALLRIIRIIQRNCFSQTIERIENGKQLKSSDSLISLNPFIDTDGCLRVGGRLRNATIPFSAKHPLILPKNNHFVDLLIQFEHQTNEHCGVDTLFTLLRQNYWIVNARSTIKGIVRRCVKCFRRKPILANQLMGDLPISRVESNNVFGSVGIDYCGPFLIRPFRGRGNTTSKCYVAVFICFSTKAVHLEIVFDLTAESFIATFRRFVARRGKPKEVWTDNGTYFVGANRELREMYDFLSVVDIQDKVKSTFSTDLIKWNFIPARTPSFGGLWERTIKSMKNVLYKLISNTPLVVEEFITILNQVEMCLNSRPLGTISSSDDNIDILTPGHFLVGRHLKALPQPKLESRLPLGKNWKLIQELFLIFWERWSKEYLISLNKRVKNKRAFPNVKVGDIGLIVGESMFPLEWKLGRIVNVYPGSDNLVRAIDIKSGQSVIRRGVHKFCPLPEINNNYCN